MMIEFIDARFALIAMLGSIWLVLIAYDAIVLFYIHYALFQILIVLIFV